MRCPICSGPGVILGTLGYLKHLRCRNCGMQWSRKVKPRKKKVKVVKVVKSSA